MAINVRRTSGFDKVYICIVLASFVVLFVGVMNSSASEPIFICAAAMPWCMVLFSYFHKQQLFTALRRSGWAYLFSPIFIPVLTLVVLAAGRENVLDANAAIAQGLIVGFPLFLAAAFLLLSIPVYIFEKLVGVIVLAVLAWCYGGGAVALGNCVLDKTSPQVFSTNVVGQYSVSGKGGPSHYLQLAGWGPVPQGTSLQVTSEEYFSAHKGDVVCMGLYPGKFGFRWARRVACSANGIH
jgi:hypothetical protein